jgi:hypothetical protein
MKKIIPLIIVAAFISSCSKDLMSLSIKIPAPVTLPNDIKVVGVIDRSLPTDENKKYDAVDRVVSLEGANLDKEGTQASIEGLTDELMKNKRFDEIKPITGVDLRSPGSGVFPAPLAWDVIEKICMDNKTDALFSLEMFDTDTKISYAANPVKIKTPLGDIPGIEHQASMLTVVKTGWRIYDPATRTILDECPISDNITFSGKGINPVVAAQALIGRKEAVKEVANKVGQAYALRIIPYWLRVSREYYVKGTNNFKIAKRKAQTGNWDAAAELWEKETNNSKGKIAGRACYNMAIINEINGNLDAAIKWAQKSYENYNNKLGLRYVNILENRKAGVAILENQESQ